MDGQTDGSMDGWMEEWQGGIFQPHMTPSWNHARGQEYGRYPTSMHTEMHGCHALQCTEVIINPYLFYLRSDGDNDHVDDGDDDDDDGGDDDDDGGIDSKSLFIIKRLIFEI